MIIPRRSATTECYAGGGSSPRTRPSGAAREMHPTRPADVGKCTNEKGRVPDGTRPFSIPLGLMGRAGIEPATHGFSGHNGSSVSSRSNQDLENGLSNSAALALHSNPELLEIIAAWSLLDGASREAVLAIVRAENEAQGNRQGTVESRTSSSTFAAGDSASCRARRGAAFDRGAPGDSPERPEPQQSSGVES
ncbi:hypothetical protein BH09PLA1_BH09PLA1_15410 [soil metagenome]